MALLDFFRINLPYGIAKNTKDEWVAFNREYLPLGWNNRESDDNLFEDGKYSNLPIHTKYNGITEKSLQKIAGNEDFIHRDENGKIIKVFLYNDDTNPQSNPKYWDEYFQKLKLLSNFTRK